MCQQLSSNTMNLSSHSLLAPLTSNLLSLSAVAAKMLKNLANNDRTDNKQMFGNIQTSQPQMHMLQSKGSTMSWKKVCFLIYKNSFKVRNPALITSKMKICNMAVWDRNNFRIHTSSNIQKSSFFVSSSHRMVSITKSKDLYFTILLQYYYFCLFF